MLRKTLTLLIATVVIASCASRTPAPVIDRSRVSEFAYERTVATCPADSEIEFCHVVKRGDTLYGISRQYDVKVIEIASRNGVHAPFIIKPGDFLVIRDVGRQTPNETVQVAAVTPISKTVDRLSKRETAAKDAKVNTKSTSTKKSGPQIAQKNDKKTTAKVASITPKRNDDTPKAATSLTKRTTPTHTGWQWPVPYEPTKVTGPLTALDYELNDGIEVLSASSGKVIYAGAGLNKFKHLVIVDTGTRHLVAYEFNTDHAIKEGQQLKLGDPITRITKPKDTPNDQGRYRQFHFEIWANGKPLNPNRVIGVVASN